MNKTLVLSVVMAIGLLLLWPIIGNAVFLIATIAVIYAALKLNQLRKGRNK